jgi:hypothetical protein
LRPFVISSVTYGRNFGRSAIGFEVDDEAHTITWGYGGLLLVTWPRDGASITLSVHGLDEAAVADLTERWSAWWVGHVGTPDAEVPHH